MSIDTYLNKKSKTSLMSVGMTLVLAVGVLDYITGSEIRIDVFYLLPISFVVWYADNKAGIIISTLSCISIYISDHFSDPVYHMRFIDMWNLFMIYILFIMASLMLSSLRRLLFKQTQLSLELQKGLDDVKIANESLEAFSYSVSHDLISPLWRIESYAQMIADKYSNKIDETGKDYINRLCANTERMKELIDALLKLSRYTSGNLNRAKVDLTVMVKMVLEESAKVWPGRQLEIVAAEGITADGDAALLQVIIFNLVENALKFTKHRLVSKIEFGMKKMNGEDVYFVRDNGVGFSMANAERLFMPFQRLHSGSNFPGFGIGLATVQRIIHRHGGRIWAESAVNIGTTFFFTLQ
jgi:light-regulated signal transduction histidine kinase (bacteriophytochrome)